ncbi:MAG: molybdenum cofactor guanylyltransferase [Myxococcota bacterium]
MPVVGTTRFDDAGLERDGLCVLVLAGGSGRRLGGVDKASLRHPNGDRLVDRVLRCGAGVQPRRLVMMGPERNLGPATDGPEVWMDSGRGPARAVAEAAARIHETWLLVLAADLPRPSPQLLSRILRHRCPDVDALGVLAGGRWAGLVAMFRTLYAARQTEPSFRTWFRCSRTRWIPSRELLGVERYGLLDVDRPRDLHWLEPTSRRGRKRHGVGLAGRTRRPPSSDKCFGNTCLPSMRTSPTLRR